jgi:hypothetical protein
MKLSWKGSNEAVLRAMVSSKENYFGNCMLDINLKKEESK